MTFPSLRNISSTSTATGRSRPLRLAFSYAPDWILTLVLATGFVLLEYAPGFRRSFSLLDTSLRHTYAEHERVPPLALGCISTLAPFGLQIAVNLLSLRSWWDFHNSSLGLVLSLSITAAVTQITKITVGRPRPDVIDRCQPPSGSVDPPFGLTEWSICTQTDEAILRDGFRSFPSGHSSLSFAGLGFFAFYLAGKLHLFDQRGHTFKAWLAITPFCAAALVAISRTMDYRHHWQDVLTGSTLGTIVAYFAYRQYYPPLHSSVSHRPYSPRIKRSEAVEVLPLHHLPQGTASLAGGRDEERGDSVGNHNSPSDEESGINGTVERPSPGSLREIWRTGEEEENTNVTQRLSEYDYEGERSERENFEMRFVK